MKKYLILFAIIAFTPYFINAQDLEDALRYSQFQIQGTARSGAMGNAFGALGGDFTSVSINPAGIALYRSGEFTITPKSGYTKANSTFWGATTEDTNYKLGLNGISYVSSFTPEDIEEIAGAVRINWGFGYNQLKDFNSNALAVGNRVNSSYMDYFADYATENGFNPDRSSSNNFHMNYYEQLAWDTDMLLRNTDNNTYDHDLFKAGYGQNQQISKITNGSINEYTLAFGINFNHKFYLGASGAITSVYYHESYEIFETDAQNNIPLFNEFSFRKNLTTSGYGGNLKFGAIYKPIQAVRLGISIHTPTFYKLRDAFSTSMYSSITYQNDTNPTTYNEHSAENNYDYSLETPFRTTFSGAVVIAKKGLISIDYEIADYSLAKLRDGGDGYNFNTENLDIKQIYKTSGNLRIGGELKLNKMVSLRGGYELQQSAYKANAFDAQQPNANADLTVYSCGIGYHSGQFFTDIAYRYSTIDNHDFPYATPASTDFAVPKIIDTNTVRNNVLLTIGYKF